MYGEAHAVEPAHPCPPHWPYSATVAPPVGALLSEVVVVVTCTGEVVVVVTCTADVVVGVVPPPEVVEVGLVDPLPPVQTAGPGIV